LIEKLDLFRRLGEFKSIELNKFDLLHFSFLKMMVSFLSLGVDYRMKEVSSRLQTNFLALFSGPFIIVPSSVAPEVVPGACPCPSS
jgi:hypothetical protein